MPRVLGITQSRFDPASRCRLIQFIPHLARVGWEVIHRPNRPDRQWRSPLNWRPLRAVHYRLGRAAMKWNRVRDLALARECEAIFINRDLANEGFFLRKLLEPYAPAVVYDFDDAIFVGRRERAVRWLCQRAGWVTPGNDYLAQYARRHTSRVTIIPTVIDTGAYQVRKPGEDEKRVKVRVGWSGSDQSIRATLFPRLEMLKTLQMRVPFELVVITNTRPTLAADFDWSFVPWRESDEHLLSTRMDIGIMPLKDDPFQKGKCGLKLLQYMAAGLPTVASPVGVNSEIVLPGLTGFLASTDQEWHQAIEQLVRSSDLRSTMGGQGRRRCELHYSINRWLPVLVDVLERVRCPAIQRRDKCSVAVAGMKGESAQLRAVSSRR